METDYSGDRVQPRYRPRAEDDFLSHENERSWSGRSNRNRTLAPHDTSAYRVANGLGWFSIGIGMAELLAPHAVSRLAGLNDRPMLTRLFGLREIATGIGLLNRPAERSGWLWMRVAGDALDLAVLGSALASPRNRRRGNAAIATGAVAGVTLLDIFTAREFSKRQALAADREQAAPVEATMIVNRPPEECYRFWRDFENLPRFLQYLESVRIIDEKRSHWVARLPIGGTAEWDSELVSDIPSSQIVWRSTGMKMTHTGSVRFEPAPAGRGTIVRLRMRYEPPGGKLGTMAMNILAGLKKTPVRENLRRFKHLLETGEIPTTHGQPSGRRGLLAWRKNHEG